jgi:hypothetical protein
MLLICAAVAALLGISLSRRTLDSSAHAQGEIPLPPPTSEEPFPSTDLRLMREAVSTTARSARLNAGLTRELLTPLDDAVSSLQRADPRAAFQRVDVFENKLRALLRARRFPALPGGELIAAANEAQAQIVSLSEELFARASCAPGDFDGATRLAVGPSPQDDFATIGAALAFAADMNLAAVELLVAPGGYSREDDVLPITRHTRIRGSSIRDVVIYDSAIVNTGANLLSIEGVKLHTSRWPGAIVVDDPCAETVLRDMEISAAEAFGIQQHGGSLTMHNVTVHRTEAVPDDSATGRGVHLADGVVACLGLVNLLYNDGGAFLAEGGGTSVHATDVVAEGNSVHPLLIDEEVRSGAIEVRDGALFLGQVMHLTRNDIAGLFVHDGGRAHVRGTRIARTYAVEGHGGANAVVRAGELQLGDCTLEFADLVGLRIINACAKLRDSIVSDSPLGVGVESPGFDLGCVQENVTFLRNDRHLDARELPVPELPGADPEPEHQCGGCASVLFDAPWCE